jgi:multicomponent Na+:H+ antiporter subunit F
MSLDGVVTMALLLVAAGLCLARLLRPGSTADRIVAVDTFLVIVVCGLAVHAATTGDGTYLDILVVAALLAFVGTIMLSSLLRKREG